MSNAGTSDLGSYSDWRTISPLQACPICGSTHLRSRDCPGGLEIECTAACGYREVFAAEKFAEWFRQRACPPASAL